MKDIDLSDHLLGSNNQAGGTKLKRVISSIITWKNPMLKNAISCEEMKMSTRGGNGNNAESRLALLRNTTKARGDKSKDSPRMNKHNSVHGTFGG